MFEHLDAQSKVIEVLRVWRSRALPTRWSSSFQPFSMGASSKEYPGILCSSKQTEHKTKKQKNTKRNASKETEENAEKKESKQSKASSDLDPVLAEKLPRRRASESSVAVELGRHE